MMKNKVLFYVLSVLLVFHFSMKFIYQFSDYSSLGKAYLYSYNYLVPQFHFNYKVFAPEPPTAKEHFVYRAIFKDDSKSKWFEDGSTLLLEAKQNRFSAVYKKWKIVNFLGFQTNQIYVQLLKNPSIQHLRKEKIMEVAKQQIIHYPQYKNACNYALINLENRGLIEIKGVQVAYLRDEVELPLASKNNFEAQLFPVKYLDE